MILSNHTLKISEGGDTVNPRYIYYIFPSRQKMTVIKVIKFRSGTLFLLMLLMMCVASRHVKDSINEPVVKTQT